MGMKLYQNENIKGMKMCFSSEPGYLGHRVQLAGTRKVAIHSSILLYAISTSVLAVDFVPGLNCQYNSAGSHSSPSPTALDMGDAVQQTAVAAADVFGSLLHGVINNIEQFEAAASQEDEQAGGSS
eukprot:2442064-Rhodomonas_salina.1